MSELPPQPMHVRNRDNASEPRAWRSVACQLRLWIVLAVVLVGDLYSKHVAFAALGEPDPHRDTSVQVISRLLEFRTQYNEGAAFGMLGGGRVLFLIGGVMAVPIFLGVFAYSRRRQIFLHIGVGLVLAGAMGNIYDRIVYERGVRDFIHITLQLGNRPIYPYIFNIADAALVIGVAMIMLSSMRNRESPTPATAGQRADRPARPTSKD